MHLSVADICLPSQVGVVLEPLYIEYAATAISTTPTTRPTFAALTNMLTTVAVAGPDAGAPPPFAGVFSLRIRPVGLGHALGADHPQELKSLLGRRAGARRVDDQALVVLG